MKRDYNINIFKAILVIGMVIGHCLQLLTIEGICKPLNVILPLTVFSGFFFAFGYVYNLSYNIHPIPLKKKIRGLLVILAYYYIGAYSWQFIVEKKIDLYGCIKILVLRDVPPYSEFMLAFFLMSLLFWLFRTHLYRLLHSKYFIPFLIAAVLISLIPFHTYQPSDSRLHVILDNYVSLIVGSDNHSFFPVLQYMFFFLVGIYFSHLKIQFDLRILIISAIASLAYVVYCATFDTQPSRFPPSFFFITGSWLLLYMHYLMSKKLPFIKSLNNIGENAIQYLLISNICIFSLKNGVILSQFQATVMGFGIFFVIYFLVLQTRKPGQEKDVLYAREPAH
jgi:hypothetical protein